VPWHCKNATSGCGRYKDWFSSRREYFIRQVLGDTLSLTSWFQHVYGLYRDGFLQGHAEGKSEFADESRSVQIELLHQFTATVGTESEKGPLWQLKDLCHQVWPRTEQGQFLQGMIFDWLIGSLFHECVKLKENLYLLTNYGGNSVLLPPARNSLDGLLGRPYSEDPVEKTRVLIGQIMGEVARQMERVGFLFGQSSYLLRRILPDLMDNRLVVRLLVEQEKLVRDIWGESLEELLAAVGGGNAGSGLCVAAEAYYGGQWYGDALRLYKRALRCDSHCQEALIRSAQITALFERDHEYVGH
jgi:hypothetical protein